ncbi:MAG: ABC transporter ATP-binding protein [Deltaproteobacteria bacterium]|nr:ABC transporter ATP-binding protein [Deltaproteobacteria bacterium]
MTESTPALLADTIHRSYGRLEVLRGVTLSVHPGEFVGLVGNNGAGKTTLLKILAGQLAPGSGTVHVAGVDLSIDPRGARARMGYVPEQPALWEYLTAREFLSFVAEVRGAPDLGEALEVADLGEDAERLIREYSQGMRRRTALAAALLGHPPVLLLDEALNGLDPSSASRVREVLRTRCAAGAAVLLSTHALETVERLASRVVLLSGGRVAADVSVADLAPGAIERLLVPGA